MSTETSRVTQLQQRATIGIITALPKEFSAVKLMLQSPVDWSAQGAGAGRRYLLGEIPAVGSGSHVIALALTDVGTNSAAVRANNLLHHFPSVRHIIMCGIAGGIPSPEDDVRLGDIVISDQKGVVNYDFIKQTSDDIQEYHSTHSPAAELLEAVKLLEANRLELQRPWERFLDRANQIEDATRPGDTLGADGNPIEYPADDKRRPGFPRLFYGPIASANRLLKNEKFRDELGRKYKTKAIEMEGSGIADATWSSDRAGYLVVRGICDFCDMRKGDHWQGYAAVAAAAYVRALLESMPATSVGNGVHGDPVAISSQAGSGSHPEQPKVSQRLTSATGGDPASQAREISNEPLEWDFFLACASADRSRAESLYEALSTNHRVFLDAHAVRPGDDWPRTISRALASTRLTIILISANSEEAHYLHDEISTAIQLAREDAKRRRVIPIFLDGFPRNVTAVPYGLSSIQGLDARKLGMEGIAVELRKAAARQGAGSELEHPQVNQVVTSRAVGDAVPQAHETSRSAQDENHTPRAVQSPLPAAAPSIAKPQQSKQSTSRGSALGCIGLALFLTAGAVGLIALPSDTAVDHKDERKSVLATLADGLKSPSPAAPLVPTGPSPGIHVSSEGLSGLRRLHRVRALQDAENGQSLRSIPTGSFGYIEPQSPEYLPNARVSANPSGGALEVHKLASGSAMIIGFARDADVRAIPSGGTARLVLSRTASPQARTAVAIPIEWIRSLYFRNQGDIQLEVLSSSISPQ